MVTFRVESKKITLPNYFEGSFILKRNSIYYLMYSEGKEIDATYKIRYSIGKTPYDPWGEGGNSPILATSLESSTYGPGHHTVFKENDQYFMLYHKMHPQKEDYLLRQLCLDSLNFNFDGSIKKVNTTEISPFSEKR